MQPVTFEIQFFPCIYFFQILSNQPVIIEKFETYQKRSLRNKCIIAHAQGTQILTVPLKKGKHEQQMITDVTIAYDEPWQKTHLAGIKTAYGSAPYFDHYFPRIEKLYACAGESLFQFNVDIIQYFISSLRLPALQYTASFNRPGEEDDKRGQVTPANYDVVKLPAYSQVFEDRLGYLPNLSILDLIFCRGPEATSYLSRPLPD